MMKGMLLEKPIGNSLSWKMISFFVWLFLVLVIIMQQIMLGTLGKIFTPVIIIVMTIIFIIVYNGWW